MDKILEWLIAKSDESAFFLISLMAYIFLNKSKAIKQGWNVLKEILKDIFKFIPFIKSTIKDFNDDVKESVIRDAKMEEMIRTFQSALGADRALVYGFENGERYLGVDKSKKKISLLFELLKDIKTPSLTGFYGNKLQGIPATQAAWFLDRIIKGQYRFPDTKEVVKHHVLTAKWYEENDIKSVLGIPIYSKEGHLTLVIVYEWIGKFKDEKDWDPNLKAMSSDELYDFFVAQHKDVSAFI